MDEFILEDWIGNEFEEDIITEIDTLLTDLFMHYVLTTLYIQLISRIQVAYRNYKLRYVIYKRIHKRKFCVIHNELLDYSYIYPIDSLLYRKGGFHYREGKQSFELLQVII